MVGTKLYSFAFSNSTTRQKIDDEIHEAGGGVPWAPSPKCQAEADASCIKPCYDQIKSRPCDGPMVARDSTAVGQNVSRWRCYSPSTLTPDKKSYTKGNCYCSDVPIRETLKKASRQGARSTGLAQLITDLTQGISTLLDTAGRELLPEDVGQRMIPIAQRH